MLFLGVLKDFILWGAEAKSVALLGVVLRSVVLSGAVVRGAEGFYTVEC